MDQKETNLLEKSQKKTIKENIYANLAVGFGDYYISPYAIALKTPPFWLGILSSLPNILGSIAQFWGNFLIKKTERKKIVFINIFIQSLIFVFISIFALLIALKINLTFYGFLFLFSLYVIAGNIAAPAFISWLGDLVETKKLAGYFGLRNSIGIIFNIFAVILAGMILDMLKFLNKDWTFWGFVIIFFLASIFHFLRAKVIKNIYEPYFTAPEESYFSFSQFLKRLPIGIFGKLVIFTALITFAANISGPYYNLYLFRDLKISYFQFLVLQVSATIGSFLAYFFWARLSNLIGHLKILKINAFFLFVPSLLWCFTIFMNNQIAFAFLIPVQFIGGIFWAGFGLANGNFFYSIVSRPKRNLCFTYSNIIYAFAIVFGSILGSFLIEIWKNSPINAIMLVSLLSSILRIIFAMLLIIILKEPAVIKKFTLKEKIEGISKFIILETKIFINEIFFLPYLIKKLIRKLKH